MPPDSSRGYGIGGGAQADRVQLHQSTRRSITGSRQVGVRAQRQGDVLGRGQVGQQAVALQQHADALAHLQQRRACRCGTRLAEHLDRARGRRQFAGQRRQQRRLAAARRTQHRGDAAARHRQVDVAQHRASAAVEAELDRRTARRSGTSAGASSADCRACEGLRSMRRTAAERDGVAELWQVHRRARRSAGEAARRARTRRCRRAPDRRGSARVSAHATALRQDGGHARRRRPISASTTPTRWTSWPALLARSCARPAPERRLAGAGHRADPAVGDAPLAAAGAGRTPGHLRQPASS